jgi:hypothetical protein
MIAMNVTVLQIAILGDRRTQPSDKFRNGNVELKK